MSIDKITQEYGNGRGSESLAFMKDIVQVHGTPINDVAVLKEIINCDTAFLSKHKAVVTGVKQPF